MPAPGRWMTSAKLRALFTADLTYDEIADINLRQEGWRPTKSAVLRKREALGLPGRGKPHADLIPWQVKPQHTPDRFRYMLQAESRRRMGIKQNSKEKILTKLLHDYLFPEHGGFLVVSYHPEVGFHLINRDDEIDDDIIRRPSPSPNGDGPH